MQDRGSQDLTGLIPFSSHCFLLEPDCALSLPYSHLSHFISLLEKSCFQQGCVSHLNHLFRHISVPAGWLGILQPLIFLPESSIFRQLLRVSTRLHMGLFMIVHTVDFDLCAVNLGHGLPPSFTHRCFSHPAPKAFLP